jgi:hypothetical protein
MKTFSESLQNKKTFALMEKFFSLLEKNSISPLKFVEWFITEGIIVENFGRETGRWLQFEMNYIDSWEGSQIAQAVQALQDLSRRSPRIAQKINNPSFQNEILALITSMQDQLENPQAQAQPNTAQAQPNTAQAQPNTAQAQPNTAQAQPNNPWPQNFSSTGQAQTESWDLYLANKELDAKIQGIIHEMVKNNINPDLFVDWYLDEGIYLNHEIFSEAWRDFLGNIGAGVKGAFGAVGNAWNALKSGWSNSVDRRTEYQTQISANNALKRLEAIKQNNISTPKMIQHLDVVLKGLRSYLTQPQTAQPQAQAQPNNYWPQNFSSTGQGQTNPVWPSNMTP